MVFCMSLCKFVKQYFLWVFFSWSLHVSMFVSVSFLEDLFIAVFPLVLVSVCSCTSFV